jgi:hypothetical protein
MNLSLDERRRRLRELAQTHAGLVLASALPEQASATNTTESRAVHAPGVAKPQPLAPDQRLEIPALKSRTRQSKAASHKGAVQLNLW